MGGLDLLVFTGGVGENAPENLPMTDPATGVLDGQWHFDEMYALNNAAINKDDHASDASSF